MSTQDTNTSHSSYKNLVETTAANGSFHKLSKALEAADLTNVLKGAGPYTFFAPTDAAFDKLPKGTLENWLKPENKAELASVLKYHVLQGRTSAVEVGKLTTPKMLQGQSVMVRKDGDTLSIGGAKITQRDIPSSNGVIHAIDTVIMPTKH